MKKIYALLIMLFFNVIINAQNLRFDTTYGNMGISLQRLGFNWDITSDFVETAEGKYLISGSFGIIRLNSDFTLDTSFAKKEKINVYISKIHEQSDGKIIGISSKISDSGITIFRFLKDGNLDTSFGDNGRYCLDEVYWKGGSALQNDKLLLSYSDSYLFATEYDNLQVDDCKIARITTDGKLDMTFGNEGILKVLLPEKIINEQSQAVENKVDVVSSISISSNGDILIGGRGYLKVPQNNGQKNMVSKIFIAKYGSNGSILSDFGDFDGFTVITTSESIQKSYNFPPKILIKKDHSIIVYTNKSAELGGYITIYNKYSVNGKELIWNKEVNTESIMQLKQIKELNEGNIMITAVTYLEGSYKGLVINLEANGDFKSDFGNKGIIKHNLGSVSSSFEMFLGASIVDNQDIIIVNSGFAKERSRGVNIYLNKFNKKGERLVSFGENGEFVVELLSKTYTFPSVLLQPNDKLLIASYDNSHFYLDRINIQGQRDNEFGSYLTFEKNKVFMNRETGDYKLLNQSMLENCDSNGEMIDSNNKVRLYEKDSDHIILIQPDNKYIDVDIAAIAVTELGKTLIRYNSDNTQDYSFNTQSTVIPGDSIYYAFLQKDGKLLLLGKFSAFPLEHLIRLNADGSKDFTFKSTEEYENINEILQQSDGKIILGGIHNIYRLTIDGSIDKSYGTNGKITYTDYLIEKNNYVLQDDDKLLANAKNASDANELIRFNTDGTLDRTFASQGKFIFDSSFSLDYLLMQSDKKIVLVGKKNPYQVIVRLVAEQKNIIIKSDKETAKKMEPVTFSYESAKKAVVYHWEFKDGADFITSSEASPIVRFTKSGTHIARLTLTYFDGTQETVEKNIIVEESTLSINESGNEDIAIIHISPNPTTGIFKIYDKQNSGEKLIQIFSINGKILIEKMFNEATTTVDIQNLPSGMYLVKIKYNNKIITKKILKK